MIIAPPWLERSADEHDLHRRAERKLVDLSEAVALEHTFNANTSA